MNDFQNHPLLLFIHLHPKKALTTSENGTILFHLKQKNYSPAPRQYRKDLVHLFFYILIFIRFSQSISWRVSLSFLSQQQCERDKQEQACQGWHWSWG